MCPYAELCMRGSHASRINPCPYAELCIICLKPWPIWIHWSSFMSKCSPYGYGLSPHGGAIHDLVLGQRLQLAVRAGPPSHCLLAPDLHFHVLQLDAHLMMRVRRSGWAMVRVQLQQNTPKQAEGGKRAQQQGILWQGSTGI